MAKSKPTEQAADKGSGRAQRSGITDLTGALQIRHRAGRRRQLKRLGLLAGVVALVIGIVYLVWFSPVLVANQVQVRGATLLTPDDVIAQAEVPMGVPLARIDTKAIAARVDELEPVASASVHRAWPDGVRIDVTERVRVYQREDAGTYQWVDAEGTIFHSTTERADGFVVHTATTDERLLADVAIVVQVLPDQLKARVLEIVASSPDQIVLMLDQGQQVIWGSAERSDDKARVAVSILTLQGTVFDVSSPSNPAVR